ncbi:MAG: phosphatidate cytidylyltransferase [Acidobacteriota bacterium]|nr:MAG: phosphatidate cytidylyltransferase [Acidobacteriota bacterium]
MKRHITGFVLAIVALAGIKLAPTWAVMLVIVVVALGSVREMGSLLGGLGKPPWPIVAHLGTLAAMASFVPGGPPLSAVLLALIVIVSARAIFSSAGAATCLERAIGTIVPALTIGLLTGHLCALLLAPGGIERGRDLMVLTLLVVYAADTAAYYGGRAMGRHRLAPRISPKKTVEGAVFGLIGAGLTSLLAPAWFFRALAWEQAVALGLAIGLAGMLGDLSESLLKRAAAVKDSGTLLPGHGGLLDRIDSLLFAAPVVYWYHHYWMAG